MMLVKQAKKQLRKIKKMISTRQTLYLFILIGGLALLSYTVIKKTFDIRNRADTPIPTDIYFAYTGGDVVPGSTVSIPLYVDSKDYQPVAGEFHFSYDPAQKIILDTIEVVPDSSGGELPVILVDWVDNLGEVNISLGVSCDNINGCNYLAKNSSGIILNLKFITQTDFTQADVNLNLFPTQPATKIASLNIVGETPIVSSVNSVHLAITPPTNTPTPTLTAATPTLTPRPTATPVMPTATPTPSVSCGDVGGICASTISCAPGFGSAGLYGYCPVWFEQCLTCLPNEVTITLPPLTESSPTPTPTLTPTPTPTALPTLNPRGGDTCDSPSSCKSPSSCSGYVGAQLNCDYGLKCCTPSFEER